MTGIVDVLYKNGFQEVITVQLTSDEKEDFMSLHETVYQSFMNGSNGVLSLNGSYVALGEVARINLRVEDSICQS